MPVVALCMDNGWTVMKLQTLQNLCVKRCLFANLRFEQCLYFWADCWQISLPKCEALSITNKRFPITTILTLWIVYHFNGPPQYLGFQIYVGPSIVKLLLQRPQSVWIIYGSTSATPQVKSIANRCLVLPIMEYGCQLWNPLTQKDIQLVDNIQCCAAHWVCGSRWDPSIFSWKKSSDHLYLLGWPSLSLRCDYISLSYFIVYY